MVVSRSSEMGVAARSHVCTSTVPSALTELSTYMPSAGASAGGGGMSRVARSEDGAAAGSLASSPVSAQKPSAISATTTATAASAVSPRVTAGSGPGRAASR